MSRVSVPRWCGPWLLLAVPLLLAASAPSLSTVPSPSSDRLESHPLLAESANPNSALLTLMRAPVGDGFEESVEEDFDRMVLVLSGQGVATLAGQDHTLSPGGAALVPAGKTAALRVTEGPFEALTVRVRPLPGARNRDPVVVKTSELPTFSLQDGKLQVQILLDASSGSSAALSILRAEAGANAPPHDHGQSEEMVYVLQGEVQMTLGEDDSVAGPRTAFRIPGHTDHAMEVTKGPMFAVQLYLPGGPEQRFKAGKRVEPVHGGE